MRQIYVVYSKVLLKHFISKKKSLCHIDIAASKNMNQTSKDEEPKHRHTKKNIDTVECLRPEEVGDRVMVSSTFSLMAQ